VIGDWTLLGTPAGACAGPEALPASDWRAAVVPGTVASALQVDLDAPGELDAQDWWYRARVDPGPAAELVCEGLATLVEAWLDGAPLFTSRNMFRPVRVPLPARDALLTLHLCFRSVAAELARRQPRPRWKTALVDHVNLRWVRTTLLGRIPGWTPRVPAIGPWRAVRVEPPAPIPDLALATGVVDGVPTVWLSGRIPPGARLRVGPHDLPLPAGGLPFALPLPGLPLWWPHTHGTPTRVPASLQLDGAELPLGLLGFRAVEADRSDGGFALRVNGRPIQARGGCWTVDDPRALEDPARTVATLEGLVRAGANMVRVGGTMVWPSDLFLDTCDRLGLLLWQDLMFANQDYPLEDPGFRAEAEAELDAQAARLARHPCVAVYCGGSEIEQQAAMLGLPSTEWSRPWFLEDAPARLAARHPGVPWVPNTPTGGALPFHTSVGLTHYYGVGAYRRPLTDARRADVRFTPECLAFAHVPEPETVDAMGHPPPHHPRWKAGVPRDQGAGWDFEDVRDHYLRELYAVDPVGLRGTDPGRYRALSRVVTGELLLRTWAEWRRPGSRCAGGLQWTWQDLRPGAGWGVVDAHGRPKAAWWYLRRAWAPRAVLLTDEGLDGYAVHLHNETPEPFAGELELVLLRAGRTVVAEARSAVHLPPHASATLSADATLGRFTDLAYAYRFGPPGHDVVHARLRGPEGALVHEDVVYPLGHTLPGVEAGAVRAVGEVLGDGSVAVRLRSEGFLQAVAVRAAGWADDERYLPLAPGQERTVRFTQVEAGRRFLGWVSATNLVGGEVAVGMAAAGT